MGYNMFAYCNNNPVVTFDPQGLFSFPVLSTSISTQVGDDLFVGPPLDGLTGSYKNLKKIAAGRPEFEVHHLIEKRFYAVPGVRVFRKTPNKAPSVILRKEVHRGYTNNARGTFPYGTNYVTVDVASVKQFYMTEYGGNKDWMNLIASCFE